MPIADTILSATDGKRKLSHKETVNNYDVDYTR